MNIVSSSGQSYKQNCCSVVGLLFLYSNTERKMIMWVEELKNGKYKFVERYTDPMTGKSKRVAVVMDKNTARNRKMAALTLSGKIESALAPQADRIRLKDLVEMYRKEQVKTLKQSTYRRNIAVCNTLMSILGKDIYVDKLTAGYIRERFLGTGREHSTLNELMIRLKALLRWGYKNDYIADISYLGKIERFSDIPHRQKIENKFVEASELKELVAGMTVVEWKLLTEFLALSGLRFGEAAALNTSDVDLKNRKIHVTKTYDNVADIVTSPKTPCSVRDVYIQDELLTVCRNVLLCYHKGTVVTFSTAFFPGTTKEHINFDCYAKYLRETSERIIGRRITPHTLRHTHASLLMEQGIDIDSISKRLGHNDSRVTKEIYLHVTKKLENKRNEQLRELKIL